MKLKSIFAVSTLAASLFSTSALAQDLEITVQNLTHGIYYTPLIIAAHDSSTSMYTLGEMASPELQAMAEGGDISGLSSILNNANADVVENPASGLLAPTMSTTAMLSTSTNNMYLSLAGMMLPTNDGFVGLNSWKIPQEAGTYMFYLNAYDAGTEANDELLSATGGAPNNAGMPNPPPLMNNNTGGTGVTTTEANAYVHVHRGNLGDDNPTGGKSDLDNTVHRWLNPVAKVTVVVK
ncbi:spondin domain-containing protein [Thalassotalea agariperforans]